MNSYYVCLESEYVPVDDYEPDANARFDPGPGANLEWLEQNANKFQAAYPGDAARQFASSETLHSGDRIVVWHGGLSHIVGLSPKKAVYIVDPTVPFRVRRVRPNPVEGRKATWEYDATHRPDMIGGGKDYLRIYVATPEDVGLVNGLLREIDAEEYEGYAPNGLVAVWTGEVRLVRNTKFAFDRNALERACLECGVSVWIIGEHYSP